ncbi:Serine incorporator 3 isoform D, partial [Glycine soja]
YLHFSIHFLDSSLLRQAILISQFHLQIASPPLLSPGISLISAQNLLNAYA